MSMARKSRRELAAGALVMLVSSVPAACSDGKTAAREAVAPGTTLPLPASSTIAGASSSSTAAAGTTTAGSLGSATTAGPSTASGPQTTVPSGGPSRAQAAEMTFEQLFSRHRELVGRSVTVVGKAFFIAQCPPPDSSRTTCSVTGYLADPGRNDLLFGERSQGLPLSENGALVSCQEGTSPGGACPGWQNAQRYRVTATVEHRVLGGRTTQDVELQVTSRTPG